MTYRVFVTLKNDLETVTESKEFSVEVDNGLMYIGDLIVSVDQFVFAEFQVVPDAEEKLDDDYESYTEAVPGSDLPPSVIEEQGNWATGGYLRKPAPWQVERPAPYIAPRGDIHVNWTPDPETVESYGAGDDETPSRLEEEIIWKTNRY